MPRITTTPPRTALFIFTGCFLAACAITAVGMLVAYVPGRSKLATPVVAAAAQETSLIGGWVDVNGGGGMVFTDTGKWAAGDRFTKFTGEWTETSPGKIHVRNIRAKGLESDGVEDGSTLDLAYRFDGDRLVIRYTNGREERMKRAKSSQ